MWGAVFYGFFYADFYPSAEDFRGVRRERRAIHSVEIGLDLELRFCQFGARETVARLLFVARLLCHRPVDVFPNLFGPPDRSMRSMTALWTFSSVTRSSSTSSSSHSAEISRCTLRASKDSFA